MQYHLSHIDAGSLNYSKTEIEELSKVFTNQQISRLEYLGYSYWELEMNLRNDNVRNKLLLCQLLGGTQKDYENIFLAYAPEELDAQGKQILCGYMEKVAAQSDMQLQTLINAVFSAKDSDGYSRAEEYLAIFCKGVNQDFTSHTVGLYQCQNTDLVQQQEMLNHLVVLLDSLTLYADDRKIERVQYAVRPNHLHVSELTFTKTGYFLYVSIVDEAEKPVVHTCYADGKTLSVTREYMEADNLRSSWLLDNLKINELEESKKDAFASFVGDSVAGVADCFLKLTQLDKLGVSGDDLTALCAGSWETAMEDTVFHTKWDQLFSNIPASAAQKLEYAAIFKNLTSAARNYNASIENIGGQQLKIKENLYLKAVGTMRTCAITPEGYSPKVKDLNVIEIGIYDANIIKNIEKVNREGLVSLDSELRIAYENDKRSFIKNADSQEIKEALQKLMEGGGQLETMSADMYNKCLTAIQRTDKFFELDMIFSR